MRKILIVDILSTKKDIISKKTLKEFYENPLYKDSKDSLEAWRNEALKATWDNPNDIKAKYANASVAGNNRIVFNIHGNKYRLIVKINYPAKIVSKILNGQRKLTRDMIKNLHDQLKIPFESLFEK